MKYLEKSFSVRVGESQQYRDNWERTFGKKEVSEDGEGEAQEGRHQEEGRLLQVTGDAS